MAKLLLASSMIATIGFAFPYQCEKVYAAYDTAHEQMTPVQGPRLPRAASCPQSHPMGTVKFDRVLPTESSSM